MNAVLVAFQDELEKTAFLGTVVAAPIVAALARSAMETPKKVDKKLRAALIRAEKKLGDEKVVIQKTRRGGGPRYEFGPRRVVISEKDTPGILAHELGHADTSRSSAGKVLQVGGRLLPIGGMIGAPLAGFHTAPSIGTAIALAATWGPLLAEEGMASVKGIRKLRDVGASEEEISDAKKRLLKAWGTYAAGGPVANIGDYATYVALNTLRRKYAAK